MLFEQGPGAQLKGEFWGGYMNQNYNGATMATVSSWTYGLGLSALLSDNVTAVFEGRREAKEAALGLAALPDGSLGADAPTCTADVAVCVSDIESEIGGRLDVHIAPNVVIGAGGTYLEDDYQGQLAFDRNRPQLRPTGVDQVFRHAECDFGLRLPQSAIQLEGRRRTDWIHRRHGAALLQECLPLVRHRALVNGHYRDAWRRLA